MSYLAVTVTDAVPTLVDGDFFGIYQAVEYGNMVDWAWGTSSASDVTLSFYMQSSVTGTFGVTFTGVNVATYLSTYTVSEANVWQQVSITVPGCVAGIWTRSDPTTAGLILFFVLASNWPAAQSSTTNEWLSGNGYAASGLSNFAATSDSCFYLTGVQLERSSTATAYDTRPYALELQLCQRYFYAIGYHQSNSLVTTISSEYRFAGAGSANFVISLPQPMRGTPSVSVQGQPSVMKLLETGMYTNDGQNLWTWSTLGAIPTEVTLRGEWTNSTLELGSIVQLAAFSSGVAVWVSAELNH